MIDTAAGLRQLVLPAGAQPGTTRIVVALDRADIPPSLVTFYAGAPGGPHTVISGTFYYRNAAPNQDDYDYQALLDDGSMVIGAYNSLTPTTGVVGESFRVSPAAVLGSAVTFGVAGATRVGFQPGSTLFVGGNIVATACKYFNTVSMTAGTTVSAAYGDLPGSPGVTIDKAYGPTVTSLEVHVYGTFFASGAAAGIDVGVAAGVTGDVDVTGLRDANSALASHTPFGGVKALTGLAAGSYTITGRWRKNGGAGTAAMDARDVFSMAVREVTA